MNKQKIGMTVFAIFTLIAVLLIGGKVYTQYIRKQIIEELKSHYTPGPYNPGFNPDKLPNKVDMPYQADFQQGYPQPNDWNQQWELDRR